MVRTGRSCARVALIEYLWLHGACVHINEDRRGVGLLAARLLTLAGHRPLPRLPSLPPPPSSSRSRAGLNHDSTRLSSLLLLLHSRTYLERALDRKLKRLGSEKPIDAVFVFEAGGVEALDGSKPPAAPSARIGITQILSLSLPPLPASLSFSVSPTHLST